MDYKMCLEIQEEYISPVKGYYTDWNPLKNRKNELTDKNLDLEDPWQFKNILMHKWMMNEIIETIYMFPNILITFRSQKPLYPIITLLFSHFLLYILFSLFLPLHLYFQLYYINYINQMNHLQ